MVTRGFDKLIQYNDFIQDERLRLYLLDSEKNGVTVKTHRACQKTVTNEMKHKGDTVSTTYKKIRRVTRSDVTEFGWKTHCFYCGSPCVPDAKNPTRKKIRNVFILSLKQSVPKTCDQRNDKWAEEVRMRVLDCHDLVHQKRATKSFALNASLLTKIKKTVMQLE